MQPILLISEKIQPETVKNGFLIIRLRFDYFHEKGMKFNMCLVNKNHVCISRVIYACMC